MRIGDFFTLYKSAYMRELERSNQLQSRVLDLENANRNLLDRMEAAHARERDVYRRVADWAAKRTGLGTIFEPFDSVPDTPQRDEESVRGSSLSAREVVEGAYGKAISDMERDITRSMSAAN